MGFFFIAYNSIKEYLWKYQAAFEKTETSTKTA
jgi:hypothetical protein